MMLSCLEEMLIFPYCLYLITRTGGVVGDLQVPCCFFQIIFLYLPLKSLRFEYQAIWLYLLALTFVGVISQYLYHCLEFLENFGFLVTVTQLLCSWFLVVSVFIHITLLIPWSLSSLNSSPPVILSPAIHTDSYSEDLVNISFCALFIMPVSCIPVSVYYVLFF